jgi:hypothetical protein
MWTGVTTLQSANVVPPSAAAWTEVLATSITFPDSTRGELVFGEINSRVRRFQRNWKELLSVIRGINKGNGLKIARNILRKNKKS